MTTANDPAPPLRRLFAYAAPHRGRMVWATFLTVMNKIFDVAPEILIGFAINVVVNEESSYVAQVTGIEDR